MLSGLQSLLHREKDDHMTRFATLLIGSALTSLVASYGFAAEAAPEAAKPAATAQPAAAPAAVPTAAPAVTPAAPVVKIGFVDMSKVAAGSAEGKAAADKLKARSEKLRDKIEARQKQIEKQKAAIEAKLPTMTPKERTAKGNEFQKKVEDYQKLVRSSELEINQMQDKLTNELSGVIKKAASDYAKANGYTILVEEKGVLFVSESVAPEDLTDKIIEQMGKKAK